MEWITTNFFSFWLFSLSRMFEWDTKWNLWNSSKETQSCSNIKKFSCEKISREEIKMVMDKLGTISWDQGGDDSYGENEFSSVFDEEEPSLEEVKQAFDVFDENKDGFIDGNELQRVLCCLGLKEGSELEECKRMITNFDENGDGLIDFNEFLRIMDKCFS